MSVMSSQGTALGALLLVGLLVVAPSATAQFEGNLAVSAGTPVGMAMPEGDPAFVNITITYNCGDLTGTVDLTAEPQVDGATATVSPSSFEAEAPPDCTYGNPANSVKAKVYVNATKDVPAWDGNSEDLRIPVKVEASGKNFLDETRNDTTTVSINGGPYVDVSYTANATEYEATAGAKVPVSITVQSDSNIYIMYMPNIQMPTGWDKPNILPGNIESPLIEGDGSATLDFEVTVPENVITGTYVLNFTGWAHSAAGPVTVEGPTEDDPQVIPLTFEVEGRSPSAQDPEESPGIGLGFALVVVGLALVAAARRHR